VQKEDDIFAREIQAIGDFDFGEKAAEVFDDMLDRSIPQYRELQRMIGELTAEFATDESNIYDLGCSTGITLQTVADALKRREKNVSLIGVDYSLPMLLRAW
jgi:tRNA (cmo5U34)-methyltransferase